MSDGLRSRMRSHNLVEKVIVVEMHPLISGLVVSFGMRLMLNVGRSWPQRESA